MSANEEQQPSKHSAEKLMQYPLDSDSDGIPASVERNPELAERLAISENDFRDSHPMDVDTGIRPEQSAHVARNIIYGYYREHGTTRQAVGKAIKHDDPAWLDPQHPHKLKVARMEQKRQEHTIQSIETLAQLRLKVRQADIRLVESDIAMLSRPWPYVTNRDSPNSYGATRYSLDNRALLSRISVGAVIEGDSTMAYDHRFKSKVLMSYDVLYNASAQYHAKLKFGPMPKTQAAQAFEALAVDTSQLLQKINIAIGSGELSSGAGVTVFDRFDLTRYSVEDFELVKDKIDVAGSNIEALLDDLYETDEGKVSELADFNSETESLLANYRKRSLAQAEAKLEKNAEAIRQKKEREQQKVDEFLLRNPGLEKGREELLSRIAAKYPELSDLAQAVDVQDGYEGDFDGIEPVVAALSAFTAHASTQLEPSVGSAVILPILNLDVFELWRKEFKKPKTFYGGQTGKARLAIRTLNDDDLKKFNKNNAPRVTEKTFAVDITIEGVRGGRVEIESTLHGMLYTLMDIKHPLERYVFKPIDSTFEADQDHLKKMHAANIQVGRAARAGAMMRAVSGGKMDGSGS